MTRRGFLAGAAGAALLAALAGCGARVPTYRYRMTVEVMTPEGLRTGSSVIEVRTNVSKWAFPGPESTQVSGKIIGEAVAVDLGDRGTLYALLRGAEGSQTGAAGYAWALLPDPPRRSGGTDAMIENHRALKEVEGSAELSPDHYPMLVRFRDPSDPTTVEQVEPGDLDEAFGPGVRLRRVTVEMTDEQITNTIEESLPWLATLRSNLDGSSITSSRDLANLLHAGDFQRR